ncbi:gustatory receptor 52 [Tribolium castaneum]|uniref:Gustatory receptor n=2 Tax=Tribolium castaneum TaxID=7070 RepID=D2A4N6_TRICA|nr:gustatory receptor 52 [Tribolium castaneum]
MYIFVVLGLLTCGLISTTITNNFYLGDIYMKIVVAYLTELNLYIFSLYVLVVVNLRQRKRWYLLMRHLEIIKIKIKVPKKKGWKLPYFSKFWGFCFLTLLCEALVDFRWAFLFGWRYLNKFNVRLVQIFFTNYYKFMLCVVLNTFRVCYQKIRHQKTLNETVQIFVQLRQTIDVFNEIFQFPIALMVAFTTFEVLNYILFTLYVKIEVSVFESIVLASLRLGPTVVWTTVLLLLCDYVRQEGEKIVTLFYEMRLQNYELFELTEYVEENLPVLTAGYFRLGKPTILRMFATVANFVIVVVQVTNKN